MPSRFTRKLLHPICLVGGVVLATGFVASLLGLVIDIRAKEPSAYQGLLTFVLFPSVSIFGLFLIAVGLRVERRRERKLDEAHVEWTPRLDPSQRHDRRVLLSIGVFTVVFVACSIVGSYHAYEFTESEVFCGKTCHTPMEPQYVTHQFSPHASLSCTDCHVGEGVQGYISAKIAGVLQLLEMVGPTYPRPIRADHKKIQIAGASCEHCHRPDKWWGPQLDSRSRFGYDLRNSMRTLSLLMKPRNLTAPPRPGEGFHWHTGLKDIWFRAADETRQTIPWVKAERSDGTLVVFEDKEWNEKEGAAGTELLEEQLMRCVDCHSRPAHRFLTPDVTVDSALAAGAIDGSLPSIKKVAVAALAREYGTSEDARAGVRRHIESFYEANFGGTVLARKETLDRAIEETQRIYQRIVFPGMKVKWSTHPNNTGHRESPGCMRCHDGKHVSSGGQAIASECDTCHVFFEKARDSESLMEIPADGSTLHSFRHEAHYKNGCWSCHAGTSSPYSECASCHPMTVGGHAMQFECSICHKPGEPMPSSATCGPCHPLGESPLHARKDHGGNCLSCHRQHQWAVAAESCQTSACHEGKGPDYLQANLQGFANVKTLMGGLPAGGR